MRYLFLLLTLLALSACSYSPETLQNAYRNLGKDYALELKQMASFSTEQQAQLDGFGAEIQQWHQQQQLPKYTRVFQDLASALKTEGSIPRDKLAAFVDLLDGYPQFNEAHEVNLHLATLAQSLTEMQHAQIVERLREGVADQEETLLAISPQKLQRQQVETVSNFAAFVGVELTQEQLVLVEQHVAGMLDLRHDLTTTNRQWTEDLITLLNQRQQADFTTRFASHLLDNNHTRRLQQAAPAATQENRQRVLAMLEELLADLSPEQKATLTDKLQSIADTFAGLAK